jgi:hypothetical protein
MIQNGPITQIGPIEKGSNVVAKQLFGQCANSKAASRRGIWSCEGRREKQRHLRSGSGRLNPVGRDTPLEREEVLNDDPRLRSRR